MLSTKWCCPSVALSTCWLSGVAPLLLHPPAGCLGQLSSCCSTCSPTSSEAPQVWHAPPPPNTVWDGAGSAAWLHGGAWESCQELKGGRGVVGGGKRLHPPDSTRSSHHEVQISYLLGAADQFSVLKAGSALRFNLYWNFLFPTFATHWKAREWPQNVKDRSGQDDFRHPGLDTKFGFRPRSHKTQSTFKNNLRT